MNNARETFRRKAEQLSAFFLSAHGADVHVDVDFEGRIVIDGTPADVSTAVEFFQKTKPGVTVERQTWADDPDWEVARIA